MLSRRETSVCLDGLTAIDTHNGSTLELGALAGVHVLVLLRHRH